LARQQYNDALKMYQHASKMNNHKSPQVCRTSSNCLWRPKVTYISPMTADAGCHCPQPMLMVWTPSISRCFPDWMTNALCLGPCMISPSLYFTALDIDPTAASYFCLECLCCPQLFCLHAASGQLTSATIKCLPPTKAPEGETCLCRSIQAGLVLFYSSRP
jgi:hypothetical protein